MIDFTNTPGGLRSQLGAISLGGTEEKFVLVVWVGARRPDSYSENEQLTFGYDPDSGEPIILKMNTPTVLTIDQAEQAKKLGAVLRSSQVL